ncbi:hypothetical protein AKJ09_06106 [Labilithrix luteola]|uniref:Uncharacterized protein n=1 Tax=Labilithrix luteola TaxID=1391654 RepID=A0A0K1Q135_9BACT|nr:hypothetical protein [Labilithrix luteola]AKU99442.1 hypothetical protein AKJ09_06106 [Labilithrix luteola]
MSAAKTARDDEELELERRLLHCLLLEHDGLNIEDVASELGTDRFAAESLLHDELRAGVVDLRVEDSVYVSLRKTAPGPSAAAREALQVARRRRATSAHQRRSLFIGIPAGLLVFGGLGFGISRLPHTRHAESAQPAAPLATERPAEQPRAVNSDDGADQRVEARLLAERKRQWTADLADRERRITTLTNDAESSGCPAKWSAGATCYVSHRNMSKTEFDEERAALAAEAVQLRAHLTDTP